MSDVEWEVLAEWTYEAFDYQLVNISDIPDAPMWRVQSRHVGAKDRWHRDYAVDDHQAACLEACHGVPNLKPGMLAVAVELLRDAAAAIVESHPDKGLFADDNLLRGTLDWLGAGVFDPTGRVRAWLGIQAFLTKLDSEVQDG